MEIKTKNDYNNLISMLKDLSSGEPFISFSKKIINTQKEIIGVRTPVLRKLAKEIYKAEHEEFYVLGENKYFEEVLLKGLVISLEKDYTKASKLLNNFYLSMDNWAVVDMVAGGLKFTKFISRQQSFEYFKGLLLSRHEFTIRFGVVCLMKYFLDNEYISETINALKTINCDKYYVNMAISWLFSEVFIKYPQKALENLQKIIKINHFNSFVINKSIQKACESYRIDNELKKLLKEMKIKC